MFDVCRKGMTNEETTTCGGVLKFKVVVPLVIIHLYPFIIELSILNHPAIGYTHLWKPPCWHLNEKDQPPGNGSWNHDWGPHIQLPAATPAGQSCPCIDGQSQKCHKESLRKFECTDLKLTYHSLRVGVLKGKFPQLSRSSKYSTILSILHWYNFFQSCLLPWPFAKHELDLLEA